MDDTNARAENLWPELERIARPARERRRLPPDVRSQIIIALCATAPLSVKDLGRLLDRSEAYIGDAIRPLINGGELTFLYPDQPRHPKQKYIAPTIEVVPIAPAALPAAAAPIAPTAPIAHVTVKPNPPVADVEEAAEPEERASKGRPAAIPNQWTNLVIVIAMGIVLERWRVTGWAIWAFSVGVIVALTHVYANSRQYQRYRSLHSTTRTRRRVTFVILKASVALVEIALVYLAATVVTRLVSQL